MLKLFDRYILKEIIPPFFLGLAGYTFIMLLNQILYSAEMFITRGVALASVLKLFFYLLPSMFSFTIPMSVLLGILAGLSRLSSDNEITAFKTLGISHLRTIRPLLLFAFCGWLITSALTLYVTPHSNFKWVQIFTNDVLKKVQLNIHPRTFNESLPGIVIYIQDVAGDKTWKNIFIYMAEGAEFPRIIFAREGRLVMLAGTRKARIHLSNGIVHSYNPAEPENYSVTLFESFNEEVDLKKLYESASVHKRVREKDIKELFAQTHLLDEKTRSTSLSQRSTPEFRREEQSLISHRIEIHKRFAIPLACFIFAFLGLPLGAYTKKGGRTSGFTISIVLIVIYYILITAGEQIALQGRISPWIGMWGPNILFALFAVLLFTRSLKESSLIPSVPHVNFRKIHLSSRAAARRPVALRHYRPFRFPNILDRYILKKFLFIFFLAFASMIMLFVIVTFFDRIDTVYEHGKPLSLFFKYILFSIPNFIYLILPVSVLVAMLLCLGFLTKFNEITAMKASGISIYRTVIPLIVLSIGISMFSFYLQENTLPNTNKQAERTWDKIRDIPARTYESYDRRWVMGKSGKRIYHYNFFDPLTSSFRPLSVYDINPGTWTLTQRMFATQGYLAKDSVSMTNGWIRNFKEGRPVSFESKKHYSFSIQEKKSYFLREKKEPDQMSYAELKRHITELKDRNFETLSYEVDLDYKVSFPLACLVMALMGIPFAFSMGKRGTLVGLGMSLAIGMVYWGAIGIFKNLGYVGYLPPLLAAWGPNLIFGLAGLYSIFSLRT